MSFNMNLKEFDNSFLKNDGEFIAGVDEAGRGPLAGPVVAAAVIFNSWVWNDEINDSKKLSEKKRQLLFEWIIKNALSYGVGIVDQKEIDRINILNATLKAMQCATNKLSVKPHLILVDGNKKFDTEFECRTIVKGDTKSFAIASASILAKVTRDEIMKNYAFYYPEYGWYKNKGYPTKEHYDAIKRYGITPIHRKTFLKNIFDNSE
ncbi:ribonuclease HII [Melioribacter sp. OK-6-Me]|uniref:ribonuclease HII n=1 Tax=unclassified Melioribacter TaxID=2627329 RepID=UPI003EDAA5D0